VEEPAWEGADADEAHTFFCGLGIVRGLLHDLDAHAQDGALTSLRAMIAAHETPEGVMFGSGAWLITARKPRR